MSDGLVEQAIKGFVREHVGSGKCRKFILRHLDVNKKPDSEVHMITVDSDPALQGMEIADQIVMEIADRAQQDANDIESGVQMYGLYAYYADDNKKKDYYPRKVFRVAAEENMDRESGPSEPASEKGLLSQLMRHNEVNSKNSMVAMGYIIQTFQKEITQQREQNKAFMSQQIDMSILLQEVLNDAADRQLKQKQAELQVNMIEGVFEHLKVALPILANRLAGKDVFPPKMDRELYMLSSLLENLDPAQQQQLQGMLKPGQLATLAELLGMYEERKHKFLGTKESEEEGSDKKTGDKPVKTNKLLSLFEKRSTMVNSEQSLVVEDARTKRIEEKAQSIRNKLKDVKDINDK